MFTKINTFYASPHFANLLGYDEDKIATLEKQGDYLESRFHPDGFDQLVDLQLKTGTIHLITCP